MAPPTCKRCVRSFQVRSYNIERWKEMSKNACELLKLQQSAAQVSNHAQLRRTISTLCTFCGAKKNKITIVQVGHAEERTYSIVMISARRKPIRFNRNSWNSYSVMMINRDSNSPASLLPSTLLNFSFGPSPRVYICC